MKCEKNWSIPVQQLTGKRERRDSNGGRNLICYQTCIHWREITSDNSPSFLIKNLYPSVWSDKPVGGMIKRASKYWTSIPQHALTEWHTHTLRQQAKHWVISNPVLSFPCNRAWKLMTILISTLFICLYFCSSFIYLFIYMHTFTGKMTVTKCVWSKWKDTIAIPLLWKILTWKYFCANMHKNLRLLGLMCFQSIKLIRTHENEINTESKNWWINAYV